jgi:hypothetical protein
MSILARILEILNALLAPSNNAAARHDPDRDRVLLVETLRSQMSKSARRDVGAED